MNLARFTAPGMIVPRLRGRDVVSVLAELSQVMQSDGRIADASPLYRAALNRELLAGTDSDAEMAFPHARMPVFKEVCFAFGRSDEAFIWGADGGRSVRFVLLTAMPASESTRYLLLVSSLVRLAKNQGLVDELARAQRTSQVLEVFERIPLRSRPIALLAAIESLLCAVVADGMVDDRHDSNQELMAQGLANIVAPLFGGIAATGAIARTATNIKSGARTPVAGIVHAITLLVMVLAAAPWAKFIPLATLSAVLINVALHMGE